MTDLSEHFLGPPRFPIILSASINCILSKSYGKAVLRLMGKMLRSHARRKLAGFLASMSRLCVRRTYIRRLSDASAMCCSLLDLSAAKEKPLVFFDPQSRDQESNARSALDHTPILC